MIAFLFADAFYVFLNCRFSRDVEIGDEVLTVSEENNELFPATVTNITKKILTGKLTI